MKPVMYEPAAVGELIRSGKKLLLAADEALLASLPRGTWIGGTIPYFMTDVGGLRTRDRIYVTELPPYVPDVAIKFYDEGTINSLFQDAKPHGFSFIMIPASSRMHMSFAVKAPTYPDFAARPLLGWITGVDLAEVGQRQAKIFDGRTGESHSEGAIVMHVGLPENKVAEVDILNMFRPGSGDSIEFPEDGFKAHEAIIDGKRQNFADYLRDRSVDTRLPLVADYAGAMINTSFQAVDESTRTVSFYAPVFRGVQYRIAAAQDDYIEGFSQRMPSAEAGQMLFSCNCILNYLYAGLEGRKTGAVTGPVTFGEIAYQLLNQTLVYLRISDL
jgi:Family of unknown function (DUF6976)